MATTEQRKIQRRIVRIGRKRRMPEDAILAALATGAVESNWRNLPYGDADSEGWRQERRQYYRNPRNVGASINRFYDEWKADADPREPIGQQAQDVQQSAFPGRYQQHVGEAKQILRREGGQVSGRRGTLTKTNRIPGIDNSALRQDVKLQYLQQREDPEALMNLALGLKGAQDVPGSTVTRQSGTRRVRRAGGSKAGKGVGKGGIKEVFHDPLGEYYDEGTIVKGAIGGHGTHVHVSTSTPRRSVELGRMAQRMGLTVREQPAFDPVDPDVHTSGSYHYSNRAIDVSGDPAAMRRFARAVMRRARRR